MKILVLSLFILVVGSLFFYSRIKGITFLSAVKEIFGAIFDEFRSPDYELSSDQLLYNDLSATINSVHSPQEMELLKRISFGDLILYGYASGLPYIALAVLPSLPSANKHLLALRAIKLVRMYLANHNQYNNVLVDYKTSVGIDYLMIRYASNTSERKILAATLNNQRQQAVQHSQPLKQNHTSSKPISHKSELHKPISQNLLLGYNLMYWQNERLKIPIETDTSLLHTILVGGSGSGKSCSILWYLNNLVKANELLHIYIADFKASGDFNGLTSNYAEFTDCYALISQYYELFQRLPEGGDGSTYILLIDEVAGMLTHFGMTKETKSKADEIRLMMSSILMLGRSRRCFLWLCMQRYTANIFPASSGSADNFNIIVGLGRLTVDSRRSLFANEHFDGEDEIVFSQGRGIILIDGQPLRPIIIPRIDKEKIKKRLQGAYT